MKHKLERISRLFPCIKIFTLCLWLVACQGTVTGLAPTPAKSPLPAVPSVTETRPPPATPTATEPIPTASATPAPDSKRIAASIDLGSAPGAMAVGDGLLWVLAGSSIVRVDPQTNQIAGDPLPIRVPPQASAVDIAIGEGALWVTIVGAGDIAARNDLDSVIRFNPQTGIREATIQVSRGPVTLALSQDTVWVVNFGGVGQAVSRIDTKTNQITGEPIKTGHAPYGMATGDGSLWVANHDVGTLTRIDLKTNQVIADIQLPGEPHRVAFGEGAAWVGNWHDNSVSRIDPQTNQVVGEPIPIGFNAGNLAAGHGSVWVTSDYRGVDAYPYPYPQNVVLIRIDSQTNQVVETIQLGGHPVDVEVTDDAVWVTIQSPDRVLRIDP